MIIDRMTNLRLSQMSPIPIIYQTVIKSRVLAYCLLAVVSVSSMIFLKMTPALVKNILRSSLKNSPQLFLDVSLNLFQFRGRIASRSLFGLPIIHQLIL